MGVRSPPGCGGGAGLTERRIGSIDRLAVPFESPEVTASNGLGVGTADARGVAWSEGPDKVAKEAEGESVGEVALSLPELGR